MARHTRYQGAIVRDDHLLLIRHREHRSGRSYWIIPGGGIEPDETEEECVRREMQEETCVTVAVRRMILDEPGVPGGVYQRRRTYLCEILSGEPRPGYEPEEEASFRYEICEVGWFDLRSSRAWPDSLRTDRLTADVVERIRRVLGYTAQEKDGAQ